ncbi:MAG: transposase zinc-binding domain-containing protein [Sandaracinaceae bacterium]|nr:transposase zinc-binding domain-containing protein [Sandaracinaceae bacterium]MBK8408453.1 transposase zinc-binding domain-containing protein [Sandaracinaceae bacterium]
MRSHGSARFRCDDCAQSRLLALSGKRRAFCPRCVGRKVADTAKHLVEDVLPPVPYRQWVLSSSACGRRAESVDGRPPRSRI